MTLLDPDLLPTPALVWGLVQRAVGLFFLIAHASLISQLTSLIGPGGMYPVERRLAQQRRDFPGLRGMLQTPTLFWLSAHPAFIRLVPVLGALGGALAVYGGPLALPGLALAWLCFLSIEQTALTIFPWDTMLLEVGFLALFLPPTAPLPSLHAEGPTLPAVAFMFRWTVARLMWGFGRLKFWRATRQDSLYLRGFLVWMPIPSRLGWAMQHAPRWLLKLSLAFMFVAEVIAPLLALVPGTARLVGFACLVGLMVGIQLTGNWGYFNLAYAGVCLCLLDTSSSLADLARPGALAGSPEVLGTNLVMGTLFLLSLLYLAMNSWVSRTWVHWPFDDVAYRRPWLRALIACARFFSPFRVVSSYGVFPPNAAAPVRMTPTFEGSADGVRWEPYRYRYLPNDEWDPPKYVAPHHPRLDHAAMYALYFTDATPITSLVGDGSPYASYTRYSWLERLAQGLLRGEPRARRSFASDPFPDMPPRYVRVSLYAMTPTSLERRRRTGRWWHRRRVGALVPATALNDAVERDWQPVPDLFHPDWVDRKRRVATLRAAVDALAGGAPADQAVLAGAEGLAGDDVRRFWSAFVPAAQARRGDWSDMPARVRALRQRFSASELRRFERLLARFAWLLRGPAEPHAWGGVAPALPKMSNYRFSLLLDMAVLDGRDAYLAYLRSPGSLTERYARADDAALLDAVALLRWEVVDYTIRSFRWVELVKQLKRGAPGILEFYDFLAAQVPSDEAWRPVTTMQPNGEWDLGGLTAPTASAPRRPPPAQHAPGPM